MNIKEPSYFWNIAKKYIIEQSEHLDKNEPKYYLDKQYAYKCVKFGSILRHSSGELAGKNFQFMEWQIKAIIDIFGTKYRDGRFKGLRRYQRVLFFVAKKAGKTELGGLLTAIYFFLDPEKAKECYSIASELEQAKILHKAFTTMIKQEPELEDMVHSTKQPPRVSKYNGAFVDEYIALSSTSDSKDGLKPSLLLVDEPHAFPNKDLYQIISDGLAGRREPLEIFMSTAGYNLQGFFYKDVYQYAKKLKEGVIKDETFYYVMFEPDEEDLKDDDYWKNPEIWKKSNPNLGISPTLNYMESKVLQAEQSEQSLIAFKTKHMNVFCDKIDIWIKNSVWTSNQTPIKFKRLKELKYKTCYAGLDLSSSTDITALVLLFVMDDGSYDIIPYFWIPKDNMRERVRRDKVPYFDWVKKGLMKTTEGNIVDYSYIEAHIIRICNFFNVKMLAYDRWNSSDLIRRLTDADIVDLLPFGQGFASMSAPTKQIEVLSLQNRLNHGNNEVLNWMVSNIVLRKDPSDNFKIDKQKSIEKVDGAVALAMALGICMIDAKDEVVNVYEKRGMLIL